MGVIKTLGRSVRQYKRDSLLAPICVIGEVSMEVTIPFLTGRLIDYGIEAGSMPNIIKYGLILLVMAFVSLAFGALAGKFAAQGSSGFAANLREDMYRRVQTFSFANIDKFSTASLVTRMTTDVTNVNMAYQMIIRIAVRAPIMLIFALIMTVRINSDLTVIYLAAIPVIAVSLGIIATRAHPIFKVVFKAYDKLNLVVEENLRGIKVVKSFNREKHEIDKFNERSDLIYRTFVKAEQLLALNAPIMQGAIYVCNILLCWLGAKAIIASGNDAASGFSTGEFMSFFTYTMQILMSLMMLSMIFVMIVMARNSADRISEVLNEESTITTPEDAVYEVADGSVDFEDVCFSYNSSAEKNVLDHVNLHIASGQTVGIIGGTGSSKSSLVNMIPRLYDVISGSVKVGGRDVREYDIRTLRDEVSMVLQKNELFSGTITENLRWGNENASDEEIRLACRIACAEEFINAFPDGYDTYIEQGGSNVSGGQKQRLCIARALLKKPKILILDDSTSAVDTKTDAVIREGFREYIPGTTKIIIAQRISSVEDADFILVMDDGRIAASGTHEQLLDTSDIYREVYESQSKGVMVDA
ncbi:MAG: ABC transporter ATP-binding protein/permease [Lachnospiraceae bacterium]|nr:ABC transporter ATP-binding protein/permease [Lachnospiraceae bacterium]